MAVYSRYENIPLRNTFRLPVVASAVYEVFAPEGLRYVPSEGLVLGEGSNVLFVDEKIEIPIVYLRYKNIQVIEKKDDKIFVEVDPGVKLDKLVKWSLENGLCGLESLSGIPGTVGAAVFGNVGAYGVEMKDVVDKVEAFNLAQRNFFFLSNEELQFEYRDSILKQNRDWIVSRVFLWLGPEEAFKVPERFSHLGFSNPILLREYVLKMRQEKLPSVEMFPNAGSFFKNPMVAKNKLKVLQEEYPNIPYYEINSTKVKIPAGWLIEKVGLKGYRYKNVGVSEKHALVLVNYGAKKGIEILELAELVKNRVYEVFGIMLEPEVQFINKYGIIKQ